MVTAIVVLAVLVNGPFALLFLIHLMLAIRDAAIRSCIDRFFPGP